MNDLKPSYYAVIPANVRYDSDISPNAKLLYGEITSLCNQKGFCWATNEYFSSLYSVSDRTIRNLLRQLQEKNYIRIEIKDNQSRKIYIDFTRVENNFLPPRKIISNEVENNFLHNSKSNSKNEYLNEDSLNLILDYDWFNS